MFGLGDAATAALAAAVALAEVDADDLGDAGLLHGDAVDDVGLGHGALAVGDDDELGGLAHVGDELGEAADVGLVERGVDFVEHAEGRGLELEDADQQRERGEGLLSAREQEDVLQLLARGRGDEVDAGLVAVLGVGELHVGLAAAEELGEGDGEVLVDDLEGLVELGVGDVVDLLDGGLGVLDGVEQVLALALQEGVAAGGLVVLLERHHVDGAHGFEALLEAARLLFFGGEGFAFDADDGLVGAEDGGFDGEVVEAGGLDVLEVGGELGGAGGEDGALLALGLGLVAEGAEALVDLGDAGAELGGLGGETGAVGDGGAARLGDLLLLDGELGGLLFAAQALGGGLLELLRRAARCAAAGR